MSVWASSILLRAASSGLLTKLGFESDTIRSVPQIPEGGMNMSDVREAIAKRVRNLREARGWSQLDLARKLDYRTKTQVVKLEKGEVPLTLELVTRLATALEVPGGPVAFLAINPPIWPALGDEVKLQKLIDSSLADAAQEALRGEDFELDSNFLQALVNQIDGHLWTLEEFKRDMLRIQALLKVWVVQAHKGGTQ